VSKRSRVSQNRAALQAVTLQERYGTIVAASMTDAPAELPSGSG